MEINDSVIKNYAIALTVVLIFVAPGIAYFLYSTWWASYNEQLQDINVDVYNIGLLDTAKAMSVLTLIAYMMTIIFILLVGMNSNI
jgi:ABC-type uncharacterized transport system permease subunit